MLEKLFRNAQKFAASSIVLSKMPSAFGDYKLLMQRRGPNSENFPNCYVFPGGLQEPQDQSSKWLSILDTDRPADWALRLTAIRETFEESGVLVGVDGSNVLSNRLPMDIENERAKIRDDPGYFFDFVTENGVKLQLNHLYAWNRFIGPVQLKNRFDTMFFIAIAPSGMQHCTNHCKENVSEMTHTTWLHPREALQQYERGVVNLAPPQWYMLNELKKYTQVQQVQEAIIHRGYPQLYCPVKIKDPDSNDSNRFCFVWPGDEHHDMHPGKPNDRHRIRYRHADINSPNFENMQLEKNI